MESRKAHWNKVYSERKPDEVSWYQAEPTLSLALISRSGAALDTPVIDVGGGASVLVDRLMDKGFRDLSVLDLSGAALAYAKERLGKDAARVQWIEADVTAFKPARTWGLWHDRAVFHFLTEPGDRAAYAALLRAALVPGGHLVMAAFAPDGPEKCSGLPVQRYDSKALLKELGAGFRLLAEEGETHATPWDTTQKFRYFLLRRAHA
jgi:trans-aconitate methyltransferase